MKSHSEEIRMIDPNSPVTAAALDAWFANANLPNAHRMAAALEAAVAEFRKRSALWGVSVPLPVVGAPQISAIGGSDGSGQPGKPGAVYEATGERE